MCAINFKPFAWTIFSLIIDNNLFWVCLRSTRDSILQKCHKVKLFFKSILTDRPPNLWCKMFSPGEIWLYRYVRLGTRHMTSRNDVIGSWYKSCPQYSCFPPDHSSSYMLRRNTRSKKPMLKSANIFFLPGQALCDSHQSSP